MRIIKGQINKVALTLNEHATTNDSEWLIKFTNNITGQSKVLAVTDISEYQERSNIFLIEESEDQDLSHSVIELSPTGQWVYTAYEMAPSSPRNMDVLDALTEVETKRVTVYDPNEFTTNNFSEDDEINNGVFDVE